MELGPLQLSRESVNQASGRRAGGGPRQEAKAAREKKKEEERRQAKLDAEASGPPPSRRLHRTETGRSGRPRPSVGRDPSSRRWKVPEPRIPDDPREQMLRRRNLIAVEVDQNDDTEDDDGDDDWDDEPGEVRRCIVAS